MGLQTVRHDWTTTKLICSFVYIGWYWRGGGLTGLEHPMSKKDPCLQWNTSWPLFERFCALTCTWQTRKWPLEHSSPAWTVHPHHKDVHVSQTGHCGPWVSGTCQGCFSPWRITSVLVRGRVELQGGVWQTETSLGVMLRTQSNGKWSCEHSCKMLVFCFYSYSIPVVFNNFWIEIFVKSLPEWTKDCFSPVWFIFFPVNECEHDLRGKYMTCSQNNFL